MAFPPDPVSIRIKRAPGEIGTDGRVRGVFGEGTTARKFDTHPITGQEAARISGIANGLRILHVNGCISEVCVECDLIYELHEILFYRYGVAL